MTLIHDNHFAGQPQVAQHDILLLQRRQEQLIHRADHKIRQQRLPPAQKPAMDLYAARLVPTILFRDCTAGKHLPVILIQFRHPVGQADGVRHILGLGLGPFAQPPENTISGGLCRQAEIQPTGAIAGRKNLGGGQRRLGLPHAHLCLYNQQAGRVHPIGRAHHRRLEAVGRKAKPFFKSGGVHTSILRFPWKGQGQLFPCPIHPGGITAGIS